MLPVEKANR